ncbi:hypothetical protein IQ22_02372 [Pseudomonas duriflava]|uniref:Uncharacterized protein n=1 Tax=Pseudomonas duriflava TaxID=459528 RepID=A0A562QAH6_9PSED|nr:hypothetical protein [Pseudomonas duriflava]TWI53765.1 hypothetical protein IQ22_02372 [Pseudomonas duriflava]
MSISTIKRLAIILLATSLSSTAWAEPPRGPGWKEGRPGHGPAFNPGPRHGHGLPNFAREVWIGSTLYFLAAGTYYAWNANQQRYVVVQPPPVPATVSSQTYDVIAYPARGQTVEQQGQDRYECHKWAVSQSGFDPATANTAPPVTSSEYYRRALTACLTGRGYSVN